MPTPANFPFASEFYVVEKTIEVVAPINGQDETIRIDALHDLSTGQYSTRAWILENLTIQPTYPQANGNFTRTPADFRIFVSYDLPWTMRNSADDVLKQALSFLGERCRPRA